MAAGLHGTCVASPDNPGQQRVPVEHGADLPVLHRAPPRPLQRLPAALPGVGRVSVQGRGISAQKTWMSSLADTQHQRQRPARFIHMLQ